MNKPICFCHTEMVFLMDNKAVAIFQCPSCYRLLLQQKNGIRGKQWYLPEDIVLRQAGDTMKGVISGQEKQG